MFCGFLDPCDKKETYRTSNEDNRHNIAEFIQKEEERIPPGGKDTSWRKVRLDDL